MRGLTNHWGIAATSETGRYFGSEVLSDRRFRPQRNPATELLADKKEGQTETADPVGRPFRKLVLRIAGCCVVAAVTKRRAGGELLPAKLYGVPVVHLLLWRPKPHIPGLW
jgi:hypothetical protein